MRRLHWETSMRLYTTDLLLFYIILYIITIRLIIRLGGSGNLHLWLTTYEIVLQCIYFVLQRFNTSNKVSI